MPKPKPETFALSGASFWCPSFSLQERECLIPLCTTMEYKLAVDSSNKATELPLLRVCGTVQQNPHMRAFWASTISFFLAFLGCFVRTYYDSVILTLLSLDQRKECKQPRLVCLGALGPRSCDQHGHVREPALPSYGLPNATSLPEVQKLEEWVELLPVWGSQGGRQADRLRGRPSRCGEWRRVNG